MSGEESTVGLVGAMMDAEAAAVAKQADVEETQDQLVARLVREQLKVLGIEQTLPPGVERSPTGQLYRRKMVDVGDGTQRETLRPVTLDLKEAREKRLDFWHEERQTWIVEGYCWELDPSVAQIMADNSTSAPIQILL